MTKIRTNVYDYLANPRFSLPRRRSFDHSPGSGQAFTVDMRVPDEMRLYKDPILLQQHIMEEIRRRAMGEIYDQIVSAGTPVVVDMHLEEWRDDESMHTHVTLHYWLTAVPSRNVVMAEMPALVFTNHNGEKEWKCPACGTVNRYEATYCGEVHARAVGCGRPRDIARST